MSLWEDPIYRMAAAGRGPRAWRDARGWLLGRGRGLAFLRALPALAVIVNIAFDPGKSANFTLHYVGRQMLWVAPIAVLVSLVAASAAMRMARDWETGRMRDWLMTPTPPARIAAAQILAVQLPVASSVAVGSLLAAGVWWLSWVLGWGTPCFAPGEGAALALTALAAAGAAGAVGVGVGNSLRRSGPAGAVAQVAGLVCAAILCYSLFGTTSVTTNLGPYVTTTALVWLVGRLGRTVTMRHLARREMQ